MSFIVHHTGEHLGDACLLHGLHIFRRLTTLASHHNPFKEKAPVRAPGSCNWAAARRCRWSSPANTAGSPLRREAGGPAARTSSSPRPKDHWRWSTYSCWSSLVAPRPVITGEAILMAPLNFEGPNDSDFQENVLANMRECNGSKGCPPKKKVLASSRWQIVRLHSYIQIGQNRIACQGAKIQ